MQPIEKRWADTLQVAEIATTEQLTTRIETLQAIKREAENVRVPKEFADCHPHLIGHMDAVVTDLIDSKKYGRKPRFDVYGHPGKPENIGAWGHRANLEWVQYVICKSQVERKAR